MLPNTVKVGGVTYTVEEKENLIHMDDAWGKIDFFNSSIRIETSLSPDRKQQSLIHEITHAIFLEAGYKEQDEDMVNRIGNVLHQVLKDNPNLLNPLANVTHATIPPIELTEEEREQLSNAAITALSDNL